MALYRTGGGSGTEYSGYSVSTGYLPFTVSEDGLYILEIPITGSYAHDKWSITTDFTITGQGKIIVQGEVGGQYVLHTNYPIVRTAVMCLKSGDTVDTTVPVLEKCNYGLIKLT